MVVVVGTRRCLGVGLFWGRTDACGFGEGLREGVTHEEHAKNVTNSSEAPTNPDEILPFCTSSPKIQVNSPKIVSVSQIHLPLLYFPSILVTFFKHWESSQFYKDGQGQDQEWWTQSRQKDD